ncbi:unnamed protein product [Sphagnum troendelagicum]
MKPCSGLQVVSAMEIKQAAAGVRNSLNMMNIRELQQLAGGIHRLGMQAAGKAATFDLVVEEFATSPSSRPPR